MRQRNVDHTQTEAKAEKSDVHNTEKKTDEKKKNRSRDGHQSSSTVVEKLLWTLLSFLIVFAFFLLIYIGCSALVSTSPHLFYGPAADRNPFLRSVRLVKETGGDMMDVATERGLELWYHWQQWRSGKVSLAAAGNAPSRQREGEEADGGGSGEAMGPPPTLSANYQRMEEQKAATEGATVTATKTTSSTSETQEGKEGQVETEEELEVEGRHHNHMNGIRCYTLEQFSDLFIASEIKQSVLLSSKYAPLQKKSSAASSSSSPGPHFFRCGTRISDLRHLELQFDRTKRQKGGDNKVDSELVRYLRQEGCQADAAAAPTQFPHLRIILTRKEVHLHEKQKDNAAFQLIPLQHFNDDYCDCYDGSDEVSTNACSMASGAGMVLAGRRWEQYCKSVPSIPLYEELHVESRSDAKERNAFLLHQELQLRKSRVGGYVVPFACGQNRPGKSMWGASAFAAASSPNLVAAAEASVFLSPSKLGDGIVDCPDGSDEDVALYAQQYTPRDLSGSSHKQQQQQQEKEEKEEVPATLRGLQQATMARWKQQKESLQAHLSTHDTSYRNPLTPFTTTSTALLIEQGYISLFSPATIVREKLRYYRQMRQLLQAGHETMQERKEKGYEAFGAAQRANYTRMEEELVNFSQVVRQRQDRVLNHMRAKGVRDPKAAGIPDSEIDQINLMIHRYEQALEQFKMMEVFIEDQLAGKDYEYYPLFQKMVRTSWDAVVDSTYGVSRAGHMSVTEIKNAIEKKEVQYPELHFCNFTLSAVGLQSMATLLAAQAYTEEEAPFVLRNLRIIANESDYTPGMLDDYPDLFDRSPIFPIAGVQPFLNTPTAQPMHLLDPAGDVLLARRLLGRPSSWLHRGGGELWGPARHVRDRVTRHAKPVDPNKKTKERAEEKEEVIERVHTFMHHTPHMSVAHRFLGGVRCEEIIPNGLHDTPQLAMERAGWGKKEWEAYAREHRMKGYLVYVCDTKDRVLRLALNGGCNFEMVVGTPSACAGWMLGTAKEAIRVLEEVQQQQEAPSSAL